MIKFVDGPAAGVVLELARAPLFLRVVVRHTRDGRPVWDALDRPDDRPEPNESIHAYRRQSHDGWVHLDGRDRKTGRRFGRTVQIATYAYVPDQPDDATMRDNARWRAWAMGRHGAGNNGPAAGKE